MKKSASVFFLLLSLLLTQSYAQSYNMSNSNITVNCGSTVHYYDPGGSSHDYSSNQNFTQTIRTSQQGQCLMVSFSSFTLESNGNCSFDYLSIYDGTSASGPLIGTYCGSNSPGMIFSTSGALTFSFHSDGSMNYPGWAAEITCIDCGTAPSVINMTNTPITLECGSTLTFYDPGGPGADYASGVDIIQTITPSDPTQCLQVQFNSFYTEEGFDKLVIYNGNSTSSPVIGTYSGWKSPFSVASTHGPLTFKFHSDYSSTYDGWSATISCAECGEEPDVPQSTAAGSPCAPDGIHPFCTDENPYGITYPSGTGNVNASAFLGSDGISCLTSTPRPAWYYMQVSSPGDLLIYIEQWDLSGIHNSFHDLDVDFVCWGPFAAADQTDFVHNLCNGHYTLGNKNNGNHRPTNGNHTHDTGGYPDEGVVDCSYSSYASEWCFIPNAQAGQWYLLMITNYNGGAGTITFSPVGETSSATTNCNLLAPLSANTPLCEGDTLILNCESPVSEAEYHWSGPNGYTATTQVPFVEIPNVTTALSGEYSLYLTIGSENSEVSTIDVEVNATPTVSLSADRDSICRGEYVTLTASGATSYVWASSTSIASQRTLTPANTTTYIVTGTRNGCSATDTLTVVVNPKPTVTITANPTNATVCKGDTAVLYAVGDYAFEWRQGNTILSNVDSLCVAPSTNTSYRVIATTDFGCTATASKTVTVRPLPTATISGASELCVGDSALLTSASATSYLWSTGATTRTIWVSPTESSDYELVVKNSYGCSDTAIKHVEVYVVSGTVTYDTACNFYQWHDSTYHESGTFLYFHSNDFGCENADTLYLIINNSIETTDTVVACNSYTWQDGNTYTQSTNEPVVIYTATNGCDSIVHLHLTVNHSILTIESIDTCDSYTWIDGNTYTQSTIDPIAVLTTSEGCDSIVHLHLTIHQSVEIIDIVEACDSYTWIDGQTYTANTTEPRIVLTTTDGCDSVVHLDLTIHHSVETTDTIVACNSYTWQDGNTYTQSTTTPTIALTTTAGCDSIVRLNLTVNQSVEIVDNIVACDSCRWRDGNIYTQSTNEPVVTYITDTGCDSVVHLHLTVNHPVNEAEHVVVCEPYTWHGTTYQESGDYLYNHTDENGCTQVDTLYLRVTSQPELVLSMILNATCNQNNGQVKVHASGGVQPYTYMYVPSGETAHFENLSPGHYDLQLIDSIGCSANTQFDIENIVHQVNLIAVSDAHCGQADGTVEIAVTGGYGQFVYHWPDPIVGNGNFAERVPAGTYSVTVSDSDGCNVAIQFLVHDIPGPNACFYFPLTNEYSMRVVNCTSSDVINWHWTFGDGMESEEWQPDHAYAAPGNYNVVLTVENVFGCEDSLSLIYVINEVPTMYLPSAFVPESDIEENKVFKPIGNSISEENYEMTIYDRYGMIVFVSTNPNYGWDGTLSGGKPAPQGVYNYVLRYVTLDGGSSVYRGNVMLIKK